MTALSSKVRRPYKSSQVHLIELTFAACSSVLKEHHIWSADTLSMSQIQRLQDSVLLMLLTHTLEPLRLVVVYMTIRLYVMIATTHRIQSTVMNFMSALALSQQRQLNSL